MFKVTVKIRLYVEGIFMTIGKLSFIYRKWPQPDRFYDSQQENEITPLEIRKKNVREKKAQKRREKEETTQDDPMINFPLTASNREQWHDSFQYKKKTDSK